MTQAVNDDRVTDLWLVSYLTAVTPWPPVVESRMDGRDFRDRVASYMWHLESVSRAVQMGDLRIP